MPGWEHLVRKNVKGLIPFSSARSEASGEMGFIYLDANESPYTTGTGQYNRYPNPESQQLLELFSGLYGVRPEQVLVTLGSESGVDHIIRTFCESREDAIMITPPTFAMYKVWADVQGARVIEVPLKKDNLQLDLQGIRDAWAPDCKVLFLCSPNNPMGSILDRNEILDLCSELSGRGLVVVDEAYQEFTDYPSLANDLATFDNLVILRTLSKAYGLAAARCAAVLGCPELIKYLRRVMASYPFPQTSVDIVQESMAGEKRQQRLHEVEIIKSERERMTSALRIHPNIKKVFQSETNFLLLEVDDADAFLSCLRKNGVVARDRRNDWPNSVRLTIGTPAENGLVLKLLFDVEFIGSGLDDMFEQSDVSDRRYAPHRQGSL